MSYAPTIDTYARLAATKAAGLRQSPLGFFTGAMLLGSVSEVIGYIAKILLHDDPFSDTGFKMSVVMLTFAPAFYAAGIYYTLKHICLTFGSSFSRLQPRFYTWIFISCDVFSILLQAVGGGIAASNNVALLQTGDNVIVAGIAFQVATMFVCICLAADFGWQSLKSRKQRKTMQDLEPTASEREIRGGLKWFKFRCVALAGAFMAIFIRCIYRIPEMGGGWGSPRMREETTFLVLESG